MREATAVFGAVVLVIVVFTLLSGGNFSLGTSGTGPYLNFGFKGPQAR